MNGLRWHGPLMMWRGNYVWAAQEQRISSCRCRFNSHDLIRNAKRHKNYVIVTTNFFISETTNFSSTCRLASETNIEDLRSTAGYTPSHLPPPRKEKRWRKHFTKIFCFCCRRNVFELPSRYRDDSRRKRSLERSTASMVYKPTRKNVYRILTNEAFLILHRRWNHISWSK